jgi:hypothetical protein
MTRRRPLLLLLLLSPLLSPPLAGGAPGPAGAAAAAAAAPPPSLLLLSDARSGIMVVTPLPGWFCGGGLRHQGACVDCVSRRKVQERPLTQCGGKLPAATLRNQIGSLGKPPPPPPLPRPSAHLHL